MVLIKPHSPVLDHRNPLSKGLVIACPFSEGGGTQIYDYSGYQNHGVANHSTGDWVTGRFGRTLFQSTDGTENVNWGPNDEFVPLGHCAVFLIYNKTDATLRSAVSFTTGAADRFNCHLPFSDGTVYWDYSGATEGVSRLSVAGLTVADDIWCFVVAARGMEIWQNGFLRASNTATPTRAGTDSTDLTVGRAGGNAGDEHQLTLFEIYDRDVSQAEIREKFADPWEIWRPRRIVVALPPAVAAPFIYKQPTNTLLRM